MELKLNRDLFLKSLSHIQGIVEKKNTIPILANVLLDATNGKLKTMLKEKLLQLVH